jgi:hypothetical protein
MSNNARIAAAVLNFFVGARHAAPLLEEVCA